MLLHGGADLIAAVSPHRVIFDFTELEDSIAAAHMRSADDEIKRLSQFAEYVDIYEDGDGRASGSSLVGINSSDSMGASASGDKVLIPIAPSAGQAAASPAAPAKPVAATVVDAEAAE